MEREKVFQSLMVVPTDTKVKAWVFNVEGDYYHAAIYTAFRKGEQISIWKSNKKGKRLSDIIFSYSGKNHIDAINNFLDTLEISE